MASSKQIRKKYIPGDETQGDEIFDFNYFIDEKSKEFVNSHERIMFIIRGPPGTAKRTLSSLFCKSYPSSVVCSADKFFHSSFGTQCRSRESLKESHDFCQKRVQEECEKGTHPIIVQNSHMRKWEVKAYLDLAAKYGYTVLMAITPRRFEMNPAILAESNRQGLPEEYFQRRLKQWEEYIPYYVGLFLSPEDCCSVLNRGKEAISAMVGDKDFCKVFYAHSKDEILRFHEIKNRLFCILAYCGSDKKGQEFYLSDVVQDAYGKIFDLSIQGFIISKNFVLAVVDLPKEAKNLSLKKKNSQLHSNNDSDDALASALSKMGIQDPFESQSDVGNGKTFANILKSKGETPKETEWESDEGIDVRNLSIIILAEGKEKSKPITDASQFLNEAFSRVVNSEGKLLVPKFSKLDDGTRYLYLFNGIWFVRSSHKLSVRAIVTGLYV